MLGGALGQTRFLLARPRFAFLFVLAAVVAASSAVLSLVRRWDDHRHLATGRAQWIWLTHDVEEPSPLHFFAVREFSWQGRAGAKATALLFVDRRYVFSFNGLRIGAGQQKPGDSLHAYDVSRLIRAGRNVVELEVESPDGAGGILFALELPRGRTVVSDRSWRVAQSRGELSLGGRGAVVWGRPPMYPWGYPSLPLAPGLRLGRTGERLAPRRSRVARDLAMPPALGSAKGPRPSA